MGMRVGFTEFTEGHHQISRLFWRKIFTRMNEIVEILGHLLEIIEYFQNFGMNQKLTEIVLRIWRENVYLFLPAFQILSISNSILGFEQPFFLNFQWDPGVLYDFHSDCHLAPDKNPIEYAHKWDPKHFIRLHFVRWLFSHATSNLCIAIRVWTTKFFVRLGNLHHPPPQPIAVCNLLANWLTLALPPIFMVSY